MCAAPAVWLVGNAYSASGDRLPLVCEPGCRWTPDIAWMLGLSGLSVVGFVWVIVALFMVLAVWIRSGNS